MSSAWGTRQVRKEIKGTKPRCNISVYLRCNLIVLFFKMIFMLSMARLKVFVNVSMKTAIPSIYCNPL